MKNMFALKQLLGLALGGLMLSSCSGGSTGMPAFKTKASQTPSALAHSAVTFTLKLPMRTKASAATRKPQYISASTQSLVITLTAANGAAVSVPQPNASNLSSCPTVSGVQTCTLIVAAPVGTDTFTVSTYDAAQSSATPTTLSGNILSTATASTAVVANIANTFTLALNGVVHSISLSLANAAPPSAAVATIGLNVTAQDPDGNLIIGTDAYSIPITLTNSDTSGATTLSTTSVTGPSTAVTIAYTGAPTSASFSASAPGATATTAVALHSTATEFVAAQPPNRVVRYVPRPNGVFQGVNRITSGINQPQGVAFDAAGNIYVTNAGSNTITKYTFTGVGPNLTLNGLNNPYGLAVDRAGNIYVANAGTHSIVMYPANATSSTTPIQVISIPGSGNTPYGVAVDAGGTIYTANSSGNVTVFLSNGTLLSTITAGLAGPQGIALDASGTIYVTDHASNSILTYGSTFSPATLSITGLNNPFGVAVDQTGRIYAGEEGGSDVSVYRPDGTFVINYGGISSALGVAVY